MTGPGRKITLVGAGPVGSLLATLLARRGFEVEVFERRPDLRQGEAVGGRSINLALSTRGLHALREVGIEEQILAQSVPMRGRVIHPIEGPLGFQPYGKTGTECIYSSSRADLNRALMSLAEKTGRVRIHFRHRALGCELTPAANSPARLSLLDEAANHRFEVEASPLIATDGSGSAIRHQMACALGFTSSEEPLGYGYKELILPSGPDGAFRLEKNALHIWPRGHFMLIALPNFDGSFTCTLFLPFKGPQSFETFGDDRDRVRAFFESHFSDALPLFPNLENEFFGHPTGQMVTVRCAPWNFGGQALLLGDAAHAIVPFFGQGLNAGFEDCSLFDQMLAQHSAFNDWEPLFRQFSSSRKPDADAIADLALDNFIEMRDRVGDARFLLEKKVEKILERECPGEYISRYSLVTFSRVPYRLALRAGEVENQILAELCAGIQTPEEVDLGLARRLIRERLAPLLRS